MIIELAIAIVLIVLGSGFSGIAIAWLNDKRNAAKDRRLPKMDPKQILETRLANGEIDEEEFTRKMHFLVYGPPVELDRPR